MLTFSQQTAALAAFSFLISPVLCQLIATSYQGDSTRTYTNGSDIVTSQLLSRPYPYEFPLLGAAPQELFPMPKCNGFTLEEATIDQLQTAMKERKLSSTQIALCYIQRMLQTQDYLRYAPDE